MKALVLLNSAAGTLARSATQDEPDRIRAAFARHGIIADVHSVPGPDLPKTARDARTSDFDLVVAGGGDGTLNSIASELIGSDKPFAVLPLGTLNHLAKELDTPADLDEAVDAIARGLTSGAIEPFNVGQVNDRPFLLFAAIGLYANVVKHRDAQRKALGRSKWPAMLVALFRVLTRMPLFRVRLKLPDSNYWRVTPLVFVALSEHQIKLFGVSEFSCPSREQLNIYVASRRKPLGVLLLLLRILLRLVKPQKDFEILCVPETEVSLKSKHVRVGMDGEVIDLETPLHFKILPAALRIVRPTPKPTTPAAESSDGHASTPTLAPISH